MFILDTAAKWLKDDPDANFDIYQKKKQTNKQKKQPKKSFQAIFDWLHSDKKHCNGVTESENSAEEKSTFFVCC